MTTDVLLRPEAEQDLVDTAAWYEERLPGLGQQFLDEAQVVFSKLADTPLAYTIVHRSTQRVVMRRFPFCVFYQADEVGIVIIGVLHGIRHPWWWRKRL